MGLNNTRKISGINGGIQKAILGAYKYTKEKTMKITGTASALTEKNLAIGFVRFSVNFFSGLLI